MHWQLVNVVNCGGKKIYRVPQKEIQRTLKYRRTNHTFTKL